MTECSLPVKWTGDPARKEPSDATLRTQAERVAKVYAAAIFEGAREVFYFLLPHYAEGQTQFGILRPDLSPRPAYVALAAAGRLLVNARPLGRLRSTNAVIGAFVFRLEGDRQRRELLVAWSTGPAATLSLPANPWARFDYLGRPVSPGGRLLELHSGPVFVVLPSGSSRKLLLAAPPIPARPLPGRASPVVLQAVWPADRTVLSQLAYRLMSGQSEMIPVDLYNFSGQHVRGRLWVASPRGWKVSCPGRVELKAGERQELTLRLDRTGTGGSSPETVFLTGNFGWAGKPVLSLRVITAHGP
ncbi:MAG: hypothetical protein KGS61_09950 [Verrucomicrobia bacterium]|nr:hypothetical protein [Verrucomicrobiota bacterium]